MLTRFTGDVMMYSKDGVYDIVDYGKTLLDSGLTGSRSLLKALTLGIVDINVDQAMPSLNRTQTRQRSTSTA